MFFLVHLLLRWLLRLVAGRSATRAVEVENAVLRHQLAVLRRGTSCPSLRRRDRVLLAAASGLLARERWQVFVVSPQTLLRWHRELVRRRWTYGTAAPARPRSTLPPANWCCSWRARTPGGAACASRASFASLASVSARRPSARCCDARASGRRRVEADHPGASSCARKLKARSHAISSRSTRCHCAGCTCCSSSGSPRVASTWQGSAPIPTRHGLRSRRGTSRSGSGSRTSATWNTTATRSSPAP
jgi:hypothetical protein